MISFEKSKTGIIELLGRISILYDQGCQYDNLLSMFSHPEVNTGHFSNLSTFTHWGISNIIMAYLCFIIIKQHFN